MKGFGLGLLVIGTACLSISLGTLVVESSETSPINLTLPFVVSGAFALGFGIALFHIKRYRR